MIFVLLGSSRQIWKDDGCQQTMFLSHIDLNEQSIFPHTLESKFWANFVNKSIESK